MDVKNLVKKYVGILFSSVCVFDHDCVSLHEDSIVYSCVVSNQQIEHSGFKGQQIE